MKKIIFFISLIAVITTTGCQTSPLTANKAPREIKLDIQAEIKAMQLPSNIIVPANLPDTIQDPILLEGWIRLYNRTQACKLWDGHTITGQQLAEYAIDQHVVITWNTDPAYSNSSWVDRGVTNNVYIFDGYQKPADMRMVKLVATMAHEMFHRTTPFDQEQDTMYEEYWAFYVGTCVSGQSVTDFNYYNPLSTHSLKQWFGDNSQGSYVNEFPLFPQEVAAQSIPEN